ncbi:MAG: metal ABC transporter ATP-binding protein [Planctomycetes bacterium]|nr:metal ABC transporter ATP-binding protein [Planctomycetota bacterium]
MTPPLVTIRELNSSLGGNAILRGVNADLARGSITSLIGLNGSGKTTLLRALLKEIPYSGRVEFHCGHDHTHPIPRHIGYVPQKLRVDSNLPLTVRDLLALALQSRPLFFGIPKAVLDKMAAMLEGVGASQQLLNRPVEKISGGELQRVLLALALEPSPELLLLDEPAAGIDFKDQDSFYELIGRLNREQGVTILLVSHEISVVNRHSQRVLCLKDGRIHCEGPPREIVTGEMLRDIFGAGVSVFPHDHRH